MNYESERRSLEDFEAAGPAAVPSRWESGACVTVTEKNWAALLSLQQTQLQLLEQILEAQATLATRWQMEEFLQSQTEELTDCAQKSQAALQSFQSSLKESAKEAEKKLSIQAGRISDQFSSKLSSSQKNLDSHAKDVLDLPDSHSLAGSLGSDAAYLSADLTQLLEATPEVEDSTTMRPQRRRKRALGEKPDEQDYQQKM